MGDGIRTRGGEPANRRGAARRGDDPALFAGGFGRERRGPSRVRRGNVQTAVLALLAEEDMHGYQIIQELAERSGGVWRPGAGSIYPTLRALQERGLIDSREEGSRRVFAITDAGRLAVRTAGEPEPWHQHLTEQAPRLKLRQATEALLSAVSQVDGAGSAAQVERAASILAEARRSLYLMLAEEES